jgi:hypothetical protein
VESGAELDSWQSPYDAENHDPTRVQPSPHVAFDTRVKRQSYRYDWLGNMQRTTDDTDGFWDSYREAWAYADGLGRPTRIGVRAACTRRLPEHAGCKN